uniref:Uncharacterized protein n=1 Tax=Arundo donax TaxID=35708 RepID=A0A0A9BM04_ARUDO
MVLSSIPEVLCSIPRGSEF